MKVLTIIVNYRTPDLTRLAVEAAIKASSAVTGETKIVVVDNDSRDGSAAALREAVRKNGWSRQVAIMEADRNGGFGYGNNLAIKNALAGADPPDYFYLLNSDAFPGDLALAELVAYMDAHSATGIAGSYIHGRDGTPHETAFRFPGVLSEFEGAMQLGLLTRLLKRHVVPLPQPVPTCEVDWTAAVSMLLRRETVEKVGLFDEAYFLYFEETDLCRRAKLAGWATAYVRESRTAHVGSASTGLQDRSRRVPGYWFDSRRHYFVKNHGRAYLWLANAAQLCGGMIFRARRAIQGQRSSRRSPDRFLRDFVGHMCRPAPRASGRSRGGSQ